MSYTLFQFIALFFIYAFLGWCCEVIFCACDTGTFVNRGFLFGPLCPIYGFGVIIVLYCLYPFRDNIFILFAASVILTSLLEFITGFVLEKLFHEKWWDYTGFPFNIKGYICLKFSLLWGIACLIVVKLFHPLIDFTINKIPNLALIIICTVLLTAFICDLIITIIKIRKLPATLKALYDVEKALAAISDGIGLKLSSQTLKLIEKNKKFIENHPIDKENSSSHIESIKAFLLSETDKNNKRILKAFPSINKRIEKFKNNKK